MLEPCKRKRDEGMTRIKLVYADSMDGHRTVKMHKARFGTVGTQRMVRDVLYTK